MLGKLHYPDHILHEIELRPHDRGAMVNHQSQRGAIRIMYHYLDMEKIPPHSEHYLRRTIIPAADQWISKRLSVNRIINANGDLGYWFADRLDQCAGVEVPAGIKKYGVWDADLLVFVTSNPASLDEDSWGAPCVVDTSPGGLQRVVVGRIWINSTWLDAHDDGENVANVLQQMTHILGFHYRVFPYWKTDLGAPHAEVIRKFDNVRGKERSHYKLVTPTVRAEAETQFGCPGIDGVDLDYSGVDDVPGYHWDKRIMYNDYMVAQSENKRDVIYSRISLAALADTGWYDVNFSLADNITWGRGKSCYFLTEKCVTKEFKPFSAEF